jgi:MYXO-CTERM domain-containing protein
MSDTVSVVATGSAPSESQWTLRTLGGGEVAYVSNGNSSGTHLSWSTTTAGGAGAYNAAIRNFAAAGDAATGDPGAPEITFDSPFSLDEGSELTIRVSIDDAEGDAFTFSWDLDDDEVFDETPGATSYTIAAGTTDGPESVRVGVEAVDASGNTSTRYRTIRVVNVAPTITSEPPAVTSVGANLRYQIEVDEPALERDPLTYTLVEGPSRISINDAGLLSWVPSESDVTVGSETIHIEIAVADDDMGTDSQAFEMTVSPNRAPSGALLLYPIGGIVITEPQPRLILENAEDQDLDTLTYYFEIDTVDSFDSPDLIASGPVDEVPGVTFWYPGRLAQERYFWRAWVSDGMVETDPMSTTFDVYLGLPDGPDSGAGRDGGIVTDTSVIEPPLMDRDRGGCSASVPRGTDATDGLLLLTLLAFFVGRRRRSAD